MSKLLDEHDFEAAAFEIKCDIAAIKAIADVESAGAGFLSDGRAKILFEGHVFYKYTKGRHLQSDINYPKWTRQYYVGGVGEYDRLTKAEALDKAAARMSASYGKFQIMGFNFALCGCASVDAFYDEMQESEGRHLEALVAYIRQVGLGGALRSKDWVEFSRRYNGPEYWKNSYDRKLAEAYKKYTKQQS
ncbi:N-acetylmuramidase family protein [Chitiniphilus purpureus]|uniref:N-acetylmuramidase family protein n=1 Tax=Chitiniphilus purpureus TaxID=2981137 RepID=A0ABY6DK41_9NEIS|nr:N-acetylmuramidase family protein [Chitiniphilus sp. CD1]UXY13811.1 N-acetylmuramidase family protein [Chitiniphilus sp. CD1]